MLQPPIVLLNVEQVRIHILEVLSLRFRIDTSQSFKSKLDTIDDLQFLEKFKSKLDTIDDLQFLEKLLTKAFQVESPEEFNQALQSSVT